MPNTCKSREVLQSIAELSGKRVSNTWETSLKMGNISEKSESIPHKTTDWHQSGVKAVMRFEMVLRPITVVGGITAHQAYDGYPA